MDFLWPVTLVYFTAQRQLDKVLLQWQTSYEKNNTSFEIQRSDDGINFITIATIEGNGNSNAYINYAYFDNEPAPGLNYYRLRQNNSDDSFTYSKIATVRMDGLVVVYPNPAKEFIKILFGKSNKPEEIISYKIINNLGLVEKSGSVTIKSAERHFQLSVNDLAGGIYFLEISTRGEKEIRKIIINP